MTNITAKNYVGNMQPDKITISLSKEANFKLNVKLWFFLRFLMFTVLNLSRHDYSLTDDYRQLLVRQSLLKFT